MPQFVLVLFGPTASGKTLILQKLFTGNDKICDAEVISADSMQVYRGLDIGTAKPSAELCAMLPHHLIDIRNPNEQFTAGDFTRLATAAIDNILSKGKLPVVCGGTGFYIKNLIEGLPETPPVDAAVRSALQEELSENGQEALFAQLQVCDPVSAARIHINDSYRLVRAMEVYRATGKPLSSFAKSSAEDQSYGANKANFISFALEWDRMQLYQRINKRCDAMFEAGLAAEVKRLFENGCTPYDPAMRAIGYREFFVQNYDDPENDGEVCWRLADDLEGIKNLVAQNSRRYAKRQITWFKKIKNVSWLKGDDLNEIQRNMRNSLKKF
ncbi:MAG: tRNA (adenosine(37)-N6)-dimethylallyltransferase MiaA [Termitinemataceae bacterium]|nr:MAG: tRNA (adenosine(37)-N6)-dimethylallyltransferase MiaA [Termitinemataceae bacterium]